MTTKKFLYKSLCHNSDYQSYSTNSLVAGEIYDIWFASYAFSDEIEIFKGNEYYTSFIMTHDGKIFPTISDDDYLKHFYSKEQMREITLQQIGI